MNLDSYIAKYSSAFLLSEKQLYDANEGLKKNKLWKDNAPNLVKDLKKNPVTQEEHKLIGKRILPQYLKGQLKGNLIAAPISLAVVKRLVSKGKFKMVGAAIGAIQGIGGGIGAGVSMRTATKSALKEIEEKRGL